MSPAPIDALVTQVLEEPELWPALVALEDWDEFARAMAALAVDRGLDVTAQDVRGALTERRRTWFERWV